MENVKPTKSIVEPDGKIKSLLIFTGSFLGACLAIFTIWFFLTDATTGIIERAVGIFFAEPKTALTQEETLLLQQMLSNGALLTPSEVMAEISSFYERVITILTTLIAFLGVIAYMYVRTVSEESALRTVREAVSSQIESDAHKQDVRNTVKEIVEPELQKRLDSKIEGLDTYMKDMDEMIVELEQAKASMPSDTVIKDIYAQIGSIAKRISMDDQEEDDTDGEELGLGNDDGNAG
jgi:hypothetical protein